MSTNDNSINARFCWQTRIRSRVISILSATQTDCLKKKYACQFVFRGKKFFRDFRFSFPRESSFPRRTCAKDGALEGGSAVKCRKAIFAYVAKRKSSSRTYMHVEIEQQNFFFYFESLVLRKFRKITAISHPCCSCKTVHPVR